MAESCVFSLTSTNSLANATVNVVISGISLALCLAKLHPTSFMSLGLVDWTTAVPSWRAFLWLYCPFRPDFSLYFPSYLALTEMCFCHILNVNKLVSLTWLLWALRSFRRFTLHVQCTSSNNHWLVPSVKTIESVAANDMVIRKPRFHRQTGTKQARSASRPSRKGIRKTKSEFIRTNTN